MAVPVEISIPTASTTASHKPFTVYNVSLRLPLRSFTLQKRYSEFRSLHTELIAQAGASPPFKMPAKSFFTSSTSSPALTEARRKGLEAYLKGLNQIDDPRWRDTSAWRTFLNLPSSNTARSNIASNAHDALRGQDAPCIDPVVWLDQHRALKGHLHDARLQLTRRDQAETVKAQHEAGADAKKSLVKAASLIRNLESGLRMNETNHERTKVTLGEGELRRRKDLISSATRERAGLENLLTAMATKSALERTVAATQAKDGATGSPGSPQKQNGFVSTSKLTTRVLGKETSRTRELDNRGVVQLQKELMKEQDEDVNILGQAVARQKELGIQIQEELAVQGDMLGMLDEDVERVQGKVNVARKRINKIS